MAAKPAKRSTGPTPDTGPSAVAVVQPERGVEGRTAVGWAVILPLLAVVVVLLLVATRLVAGPWCKQCVESGGTLGGVAENRAGPV